MVEKYKINDTIIIGHNGIEQVKEVDKSVCTQYLNRFWLYLMENNTRAHRDMEIFFQCSA